MSAKPPTRSAQFRTGRTTCRTRAGGDPRSLRRPRAMAPETIVIPPKYAKAIRPSAVERAEAAVADRAEVVRVQRAGHPRDERRDAEGGELRVADVDPGGRGGALVRADRQHPLAEARAAHIARRAGEQDRHREDEEAEDRARQVVVQSPERCTRERSSPPICRLRRPASPSPATPARIEEAELLERDRAASVTTTRLTPRTRKRRDRDQQPERPSRPAAPISSEIGNSAQMPPRSVVRCDIVKPRDTGERELDDGDLADEADDDDEREADDDARAAS